MNRLQGRGWKAIARKMKLGVGTVLRTAQQIAQTGAEDRGETVVAT